MAAAAVVTLPGAAHLLALSSGAGTQIAESTMNGLTQGSVFALFALGYTLVYGVLRLINFAHSEVFMLGTFGAVYVWQRLGYDQNSQTPSVGGAIVLVLVALAAAMTVSAVAAALVEVVAYRPLRRRGAPPLAFLITAIGTSVTISEAVGVATDRRQVAAPRMFDPHPWFTVGPLEVTRLQVLVIASALVLMYALDRTVRRTRLGRGIRAVAQDPESAALMGVNSSRVVLAVFLLGGLAAGVAAVLYDLKIGSARFDFGFDLGVKAFAAAVLGGIGNLRGALAGGIVLGLAQSYGAGLFGTAWGDVVVFLLLVLVLLLRPTGLLGDSMGRKRS